MTGSRFVLPGAALAATLGSIGAVLFAPIDPGPFLVVAAVGPPVTALLLADAVAGGASRSLVPSVLIAWQSSSRITSPTRASSGVRCILPPGGERPQRP